MTRLRMARGYRIGGVMAKRNAFPEVEVGRQSGFG